jgi:hypothetical protein
VWANGELGSVTRLQKNRFSMVIEELFLSFREGSNVHKSVRFYAHAIQRGHMGDSRFAYVAVSRASLDAEIYTNDATGLGHRLSGDVSKTCQWSSRTLPVSTQLGKVCRSRSSKEWIS